MAQRTGHLSVAVTDTVDGSKYPYQASRVTGMWGGKLMCETRNENPTKKRKVLQSPEQRYTAHAAENV